MLGHRPANKSHWSNVVLMLVYRLQLWPNIKTTLCQQLLFNWRTSLKTQNNDPVIAQSLSSVTGYGKTISHIWINITFLPRGGGGGGVSRRSMGWSGDTIPMLFQCSKRPRAQAGSIRSHSNPMWFQWCSSAAPSTSSAQHWAKPTETLSHFWLDFRPASQIARQHWNNCVAYLCSMGGGEGGGASTY